MKKLLSLLVFFAGVSVFAGNNQLQVGDEAPHSDVKMTCVSGKTFSLADLKQDNGLVVIFSCNTCPFVKKWEGRYNDLKSWADKHQVGMAVLNSNYRNRSGVDSYEAMQTHAKEHNYQFPYLVDRESLLANAIGGQTTPHVFLFNSEMKLVYKGAIEDNYDDESKVNNAYLKNAIKSISEGGTVNPSETKPIGCGIKRKTI
ncbi:thioredoxin family protein [Sunxiuqinia sp. A32]|uniref:thioredoxin family protein n=1 Tax=Sunxiuqinia sp. A32 TaxID=3461496 RepID=UPI0040467EC0